MMEVRKVSAGYRKTLALQDIDLSFAPGTLYAIIGPNGSGKTTLIKLLARLIRPRSGALMLEGSPYDNWGRRDFAKQAALLPQGRNIPDMTVYDLVCCGRYPYLDISRRLRPEDREIVQSALAATGTEGLSHRNVKQLSGGERQRVYLAMLRAQDTPYVLLDEPTTHLDIAAGFQAAGQLLALKQEGKCVIAVLHDLSLALKYADEIILMDKGRVLMSAPPGDLLKSGALQSVFGVRCTPVEQNGKTEYIFEGL